MGCAEEGRVRNIIEPQVGRTKIGRRNPYRKPYFSKSEDDSTTGVGVLYVVIIVLLLPRIRPVVHAPLRASSCRVGDNAVNRSVIVPAVITIKKGGKNLDGRALQTAIIHGSYHREKSRRHVGLIITTLLLFLSAARAGDESCVAWFPDVYE